jgi:hypothetical protein
MVYYAHKGIASISRYVMTLTHKLSSRRFHTVTAPWSCVALEPWANGKIVAKHDIQLHKMRRSACSCLARYAVVEAEDLALEVIINSNPYVLPYLNMQSLTTLLFLALVSRELVLVNCIMDRECGDSIATFIRLLTVSQITANTTSPSRPTAI